jgi:hypothetical protein
VRKLLKQPCIRPQGTSARLFLAGHGYVARFQKVGLRQSSAEALHHMTKRALDPDAETRSPASRAAAKRKSTRDLVTSQMCHVPTYAGQQRYSTVSSALANSVER